MLIMKSRRSGTLEKVLVVTLCGKVVMNTLIYRKACKKIFHHTVMILETLFVQIYIRTAVVQSVYIQSNCHACINFSVTTHLQLKTQVTMEEQIHTKINVLHISRSRSFLIKVLWKSVLKIEASQLKHRGQRTLFHQCHHLLQLQIFFIISDLILLV
ncbi:unnamed protein product [Trichobilharzia regenti]|nr:unnamed protein product [Trichobilharzia regenti]